MPLREAAAVAVSDDAAICCPAAASTPSAPKYLDADSVPVGLSCVVTTVFLFVSASSGVPAASLPKSVAYSVAAAGAAGADNWAAGSTGAIGLGAFPGTEGTSAAALTSAVEGAEGEAAPCAAAERPEKSPLFKPCPTDSPMLLPCANAPSIPTPPPVNAFPK